MTFQHYRGYDIEVCCTPENGRHGCGVRILNNETCQETHAWASEAGAFACASDAEDKGFQYARAWIEQHSLRWPFAPRR
jgi:hypothetical protein